MSPPSSPLIDSGYSSSLSDPKSTPGSRMSSAASSSDDEMAVTSRELRDATRAFFGGINNHSGAAKEKMRCFRVARLGD